MHISQPIYYWGYDLAWDDDRVLHEKETHSWAVVKSAWQFVQAMQLLPNLYTVKTANFYRNYLFTIFFKLISPLPQRFPPPYKPSYTRWNYCYQLTSNIIILILWGGIYNVCILFLNICLVLIIKQETKHTDHSRNHVSRSLSSSLHVVYFVSHMNKHFCYFHVVCVYNSFSP